MIVIPLRKSISTLLLGMLVAAATSALAAETTAPVTEGASALRVYRDPATGKLREPEHDEAKAVQAGKQDATRPTTSAREVPARTYTTRSGGTAVKLGKEYLNYSVAVKKPDGSVAMHCVEGKEAADELLNHDAAPVSTKKEQANDR